VDIAVLRLVSYGNVPLPSAGAHFYVLQSHGNRYIQIRLAELKDLESILAVQTSAIRTLLTVEDNQRQIESLVKGQAKVRKKDNCCFADCF